MNEPTPRPQPEIRWATFQEVVYELCAAIVYFRIAIADDTSRPYREREQISKRLRRVADALLFLTLRMNLFKIGKEFFAAMRQPPVRRPHIPCPPREPGSTHGRPGSKPVHLRPRLSARATARRLAALLRKLDAIVHDYSLVCPEEILERRDWLRAEAGCDTLPDCPPFTPTQPPRPRSPMWPHPTKPGVWLAWEPEDWPLPE